jgi:hypothetical protein
MTPKMLTTVLIMQAEVDFNSARSIQSIHPKLRKTMRESILDKNSLPKSIMQLLLKVELKWIRN